MNREIDYTGFSDEELIKLHRNGDIYAQDLLLDKYKNLVKIKSRTYFIIGADNDDLVQEGMIGLFKAIRDFDLEKNEYFYPFAELCITRQMITAIKSATRKKHVPLNSYVSLNNQIFDSAEEVTYIDFIIDDSVTNPEEVFIGNEGKVLIESYIKDYLSDLEEQVLRLYFDGNSYSDIGKKIGKGEKSVDNAVQRIRKKIANALKENVR